MTIPSPVVLLYQPPGLPFNSSTLCPHSAFMCFAWISKQTAIISIQRLKTAFTGELRCVYSAVRAGSLNKPQINVVFKGLMENVVVFCILGSFLSNNQILWLQRVTGPTLTNCGQVTQICILNTVNLGTSASSP